ncbi:M1 family aminopeptidase [candidate division KSB1 bacterium]
MKKMIFISILFLISQAIFAQYPKPELQKYDIFIDKEIKAKKRAVQRSLLEPKDKLLQQGDYDAVYYGLNLNIDVDNENLSGSTIIKGKSNVNELSAVVLDFFDNMNVVSVSGDAASFTHSNDILTVSLDRRHLLDEVFTIIVDYDGKPVESGLASFTFREIQGNPIISSLSEPYLARAWWPCKDIPDDKADSADINITVPSDLTASSNGLLREKIDNQDGTVTYKWHEKYPISTYLISVAVSNYETFSHWYKYTATDSMEVQYYVFPDDVNGNNPGIDLCVEMIEVFSEAYGQYPFIDEKYGMSQFTWGGAMEHQTNSSMTDFGESVTAHELAHQWWGDMVTCSDWHNIWINEGFASFSSALWEEKKYGKAAYEGYLNFWANRSYTGSIYIHDISDPWGIFDRIVYYKAAFVLHMLRNIVGDDTFFAILLEYRDLFKWGNASTEDFQAVCEELYGNDLDWFFQQWIYGEGRPYYEYGWQYAEGDTSNYVFVRIKQIQGSSTTFQMPVTVRLSYNSGYQDYVIDNITKDELHTIAVQFPPNSVEIDPENLVLKYVTQVEFDTTGIDPYGIVPNNFSISKNYPNPFNSYTNVKIYLPKAQRMSLSVYNILGQEIRKLYSGFKNAGIYVFDWDGKDNTGSYSASGVYFIRFSSDEFTGIQKVIYLK